MSKPSTKPKPVLLDYRFLGTTFLGAVSVGAVSVFGSLAAQVAMLGTWISILAGLVITQIQNFEHSKCLDQQQVIEAIRKRKEAGQSLLAGIVQTEHSSLFYSSKLYFSTWREAVKAAKASH